MKVSVSQHHRTFTATYAVGGKKRRCRFYTDRRARYLPFVRQGRSVLACASHMQLTVQHIRTVHYTRLQFSTLKSTVSKPSTRKTWCSYILRIGTYSRSMDVLVRRFFQLSETRLSDQLLDEQIMHSTGVSLCVYL